MTNFTKKSLIGSFLIWQNCFLIKNWKLSVHTNTGRFRQSIKLNLKFYVCFHIRNFGRLRKVSSMFVWEYFWSPDTELLKINTFPETKMYKITVSSSWCIYNLIVFKFKIHPKYKHNSNCTSKMQNAVDDKINKRPIDVGSDFSLECVRLHR